MIVGDTGTSCATTVVEVVEPEGIVVTDEGVVVEVTLDAVSQP